MVFKTKNSGMKLLYMLVILTFCYFAILIMSQNSHITRLAERSNTIRVRPEASLIWTGLLPSWVYNSSDHKRTTRHGDVETERKALLIPKDDDIAKMDEGQKKQLYWKYINTLQVLCRNQTRLGSFKDGGKEMCIDNEFIPKKPCLVYSFGSNLQFDFEESVINAFGCEVHTFDPTVDLRKKRKIPKGIQFHLVGLAGSNHVTEKNWQMATLQTIFKELHHTNRTLDLLKIDIEGSEWNALSHMFEVGSLNRTKQLLIEVHFDKDGKKGFWGNVNTRNQLKVLRELHENGFRLFMREHNLYSLTVFKSKYNTKYTSVNEISLVNMNYRH